MRRGLADARQIRRAWHSTSFRISTIYAALVLISVGLMFEVVTWSVERVARHQIDHDVSEETQEVLIAARGDGLAALQGTVASFLTNSPDMYYSLENNDGAVLIGNLPPLAPRPGWRLLAADGRSIRVHGHAVQGGYLLVGVNDIESSMLGQAISRTFMLGLGATVLLALGTGLLTSLVVLRRMEAVSRASHAIMAGDLHRRIPVRGTDDEFDHLATVLNQMLDRIQTLMSDVQQVTSDLAHDLRTPLTRLRQRLELAASGDAEALRTALHGSVSDVDAILSTFSALLRIAQIEAGSRRAGFASVDLPALTLEMAEIYQPVAEEGGRHLILPATAAHPAPAIRGDRSLLVQLLSNLLENAIRHTPPGSTIAARAEMVADHWWIVVDDDGPGIPPEQRQRVLARFTRLEASRSTQGNGLGLALVVAIAGLHKGQVRLEDNHPGLRVMVQFGAG